MKFLHIENKTQKAKLMVLVGVLFVSFSAILIKLSTSPSLVVAFYRLLFSTLLIIPFILKESSALRGISKKTLLLSILSGLFLALHFATWIESLQYTSIASSTLLVCISPIFTLIGGYFILSEKVSKIGLISIWGTLFGSIIISYGDFELGGSALYGDFLALLGAVFVAGYMIIGRIVRKDIKVMPYTFIVYGTSSVVLLILGIASKVSFIVSSPIEWLLFFGLAVLSTLLGHSIFNWALEYVNPTYISTAVLAEPVLTILWAYIVFIEVPNLFQLLGSVVIIISIYFYVKE